MVSMPDKQYLRILPRPLHLPPTTRVSRSRGPASSSERGRSFRERRRRRVEELEQQVETLQREVESLVSSRALSEGRLLQRRNNKDSSLVRLVREYYTIFQYGFRDGPASVYSVALRPPKNAMYKENFMRSIMAEDVITGDLVGLEAALLQWRFFTFANVAIEYVDISGSEDDPCVEIHAQFHFLPHPMMLARAFPGAESNPELMKIFGRKQLVIPVVSRFQFTPEGKIRFEDVNTNIIAGYHCWLHECWCLAR